jgi:hypothetical protein
MIVRPTGSLVAPTGVTPISSASAANSANVSTVAAQVNMRTILHFIQFSYPAGATGTTIQVEDGAGGPIIFRLQLSTVLHTAFPCFIRGSVNTAMVLTLGAGGAGVVSFLNYQFSRYGG